MAYWPVSDEPLNYITWSSPYGYLRGPTNINPSPYVTRNVGSGNKRLPSLDEYIECLNSEEFNIFWICVCGTYGDPACQSEIHGGVHAFVGGDWNVSIFKKLF
jgi:hypothetical protein